MARTCIVLAIAAVVASGCNPAYSKVETQARKDLSCESIRVDDIYDRVFGEESWSQKRATGCNKSAKYIEHCPEGAYPGADSCKWMRLDDQRRAVLLRRAAFESGCPETSLQINELDANTWGVSGCDKRATYVWSCPYQPEKAGPGCKWLMNTESMPKTPAVPATAPAPTAGQ